MLRMSMNNCGSWAPGKLDNGRSSSSSNSNHNDNDNDDRMSIQHSTRLAAP